MPVVKQYSVWKRRARDPWRQSLAKPWWRHQMETLSALLALCAGNSPVTGEFPSQRPVTRSFDVFFDLRLNQKLFKQSRRRGIEIPLCSLWRHCYHFIDGLWPIDDQDQQQDFQLNSQIHWFCFIFIRSSYNHFFAMNPTTNSRVPDDFKIHDDVIKWKHFPRYWPFVRGIHRFPVNSPHKGQWRGALSFSLICARINGWVNNGEAGDLRRHHGHYDVTVMWCQYNEETEAGYYARAERDDTKSQIMDGNATNASFYWQKCWNRFKHVINIYDE